MATKPPPVIKNQGLRANIATTPQVVHFSCNIGWSVGWPWERSGNGRALVSEFGGEAFRGHCTGMVEADEIHRMLDILVGSDALGYRKLFDGSRADTKLGALDVQGIGVRMRTPR